MWKVGQLAKRSGISVRTLHHYDEIGLLVPSHRTESGHRLYDDGDVVRLQQIVSLRQLGFSLERIAEMLGRSGMTQTAVVDMHLGAMREQIRLQRSLCIRLERLAGRLRARTEVPADELLKIIEEITMFDKYFTPDQQKTLHKRAEELGPQGMEAAQREWPQLISDVKAEFERGTDPADPRVQALAKRWMELVQAFSGGDPAIEQSVRTMYRSEPAATKRFGVDPRLFEYIGKAMKR